jgi:hypothetical protein
MKRLFGAVGALALAAAASGSLIAAGAGTAFAASIPPWESGGTGLHDSNEIGSLSFFNAAGQQIVGGNVTDAPLAAYVEGSTALRTGDTNATLWGYTPVNGTAPGSWSGEALSSSTVYPNASAPAPLNTAALPVVTGHSTDETVGTYAADFPNTDASTTDGYGNNVYELRLYTTASGKTQTGTYDAADIQITGSTWSVIYPAPTQVSTTTGVITSAGSNPVTSGNSVTLTASVSPSVSGTVQFSDSAGNIGSGQTVTNGQASISTSTLPVGNDTITAVFTPGQFLDYSGSTGTALVDVTAAPAANTAIALSAPTSGVADTATSLVGTVTTGTSHTPLTTGDGSVKFYDDGTDTSGSITGTSVLLGTVAVGSGGTATLSYSSFGVGSHNLVAQFQPANPAVYNSSTTPGAVLFTATAPQWQPQAQTLKVGIPAGSLTISSPYSAQNPLDFGTAVLDPSGGFFKATAQFGSTSGDTDTPTSATSSPTYNGVTITDTRAGQQGWTAYATVTDFSGGGNTINGENLSFTNVTPEFITGDALQSGSVAASNVPSGSSSYSPPYSPSDSGTNGLKGGPHQFATASSGDSDGSVGVSGLLTLVAPSSAPSGEYTATLTFTIS